MLKKLRYDSHENEPKQWSCELENQKNQLKEAKKFPGAAGNCWVRWWLSYGCFKISLILPFLLLPAHNHGPSLSCLQGSKRSSTWHFTPIGFGPSHSDELKYRNTGSLCGCEETWSLRRTAETGNNLVILSVYEGKTHLLNVFNKLLHTSHTKQINAVSYLLCVCVCVYVFVYKVQLVAITDLIWSITTEHSITFGPFYNLSPNYFKTHKD